MVPDTRVPENRAWVDFAKGAAIILVVLYHSALFLDEFGLAGGTTRLRSVLLFFPMPVFFFIAGLTVAKMRTWSFAELWRRRLQVFVWLYLLWSALRAVFYVIVPFRRIAEPSPTDPLQIALLPVLPTSSYWFIWALAIFTLLIWLLRKTPVRLQISAAVLVAIVSTTPHLLDFDNVGWDRVAQNFVFFIAASFFPTGVYRWAAKVRISHAIALSAAYLAVVLAIVLLGVSWVPGVVFFATILAVAAGISLSVVLAPVRWLNVIAVLGRHSLPIYLVHLFVIALVAWWVAPLADFSLLRRFSAVLPYLLAVFTLAASFSLFRLTRPVSWLWVSPFSRKVRPRTPPQTQRLSRNPPQQNPLRRQIPQVPTSPDRTTGGSRPERETDGSSDD